jgi:nucleoside-diphosphate-sugar epimerase
MDILLTGATGYIGSRVAAALDAAAIDWKPLATRLERIVPRSLRCDAAIHCAGALRARKGQEYVVNAHGTATLVKGMARGTRIVFVSSRSVYPRNGHVPVDESASAKPFDDYGASKLAAERVLMGSEHRVAIFRSAGVFGHPTRAGTFPDHALERALRNEAITVATPDRHEDYVAVDWLAEILARAAVDGAADGAILNVAGPGRPLRSMIDALVEVVTACCDSRPTLNEAALPLPTYPLLDTRALHERLHPPPHPSDQLTYRNMVAARNGHPR